MATETEIKRIDLVALKDWFEDHPDWTPDSNQYVVHNYSRRGDNRCCLIGAMYMQATGEDTDVGGQYWHKAIRLVSEDRGVSMYYLSGLECGFANTTSMPSRETFVFKDDFNGDEFNAGYEDGLRMRLALLDR